MKKHKTGGIILLLLEIVGVLIILIGAYIYLRTNSTILDKVVEKDGSGLNSDVSNSGANNVVPNGKCGFLVTSHSQNEKVGFPLTIKGIVDNTDTAKLGCSWQMFEGQAGIAQLYFKYKSGDWQKLGVSVPVIVENWTSNKTLFSVGLNFNNEGVGLADGTLLKVVFTEENASGMPPVDTYDLPLVFMSGANATSTVPSSELMSLNLYIQDKEIARVRDCGVTKRVTYQVPKTLAVADASLKILFANELAQYGVYKSVSISNKVAKVMLASENIPSGRPIGGLSSCESSHLMSVLKDTLTQYDTIKSVELYSPKGKIIF